MRVLLDTHVVVWWVRDRTEFLSAAVCELLSDEVTDVAVSAATVWEASIKCAKGRMPDAAGLLGALEEGEVTLLPITPRLADRAGSLVRHHGDPFDRLLVAQAQMEGWPLVSKDRQLGVYGIEILW